MLARPIIGVDVVIKLFVAVLALWSCGCAHSVADTWDTPIAITASSSASGARTYVVGGHVNGLRGIGLVLRNNGGDDVVVLADGTFTFGTPLDDGASFSVTIAREPIAPAQSCTSSNATGSIAGASVATVEITCSVLALALD